MKIVSKQVVIIKLFRYAFLGMLMALSFGCDEIKEDPNDAAASFVNAREAYDDGYYEMALPKLQEYKARFPYSQYSREAELLIADSHFKLKQYPEAAAVYDQFVRLHPTHPKVDFAQYRVGQCYWEEAPEEVDREQEFTAKAIDIWQELIQRFPNSEYRAEAEKNVNLGLRRLAEADVFIAEFYCKREKWSACAYRAIGLIEKHKSYKDLVKKGAVLGAKAFNELANELDAGEIKRDANLFTRKMDSKQLRDKAAELERIQSKL